MCVDVWMCVLEGVWMGGSEGGGCRGVCRWVDVYGWGGDGGGCTCKDFLHKGQASGYFHLI